MQNRFGLIGKSLSYSYSKEIHEKLGYYKYDLIEIEPYRLPEFFKNKEFSGINVTIPYKQSVIKYLDMVDDSAVNIGAVNTIINKDGALIGWNTDAYGLLYLIDSMVLHFKDKKVLITGSGGTSKTAKYVAEYLGAKQIYRLSRSGKDNCLAYGKACKQHYNADIIINTTPVGMYPNIKGICIDLDRFTNLTGVVDVVYNPIESRLVKEAREKGINAQGGLLMLVAQAVQSARLFTGIDIDDSKIDEIYEWLKGEKNEKGIKRI